MSEEEDFGSSLRNLGVLCVSAVNVGQNTHRKGAEHAE